MIQNINPINDQVQKQLIDWVLQNQNQIGLGSVPVGILTNTLNQILPPMVSSYTGEVYTQTNQSLNQGPSELFGANNPFNTLTQNQNTNLITSAILSRLGSSGTGALQNNLVGNMIAGLQGGLGNFGNTINYQLLSATISSLIGPLFNTLNKQVSGNFVDGVLSNEFEVDPFLTAEDYSFGDIAGDPEADLEQLDTDYTKTATNTFLAQARILTYENLRI